MNVLTFKKIITLRRDPLTCINVNSLINGYLLNKYENNCRGPTQFLLVKMKEFTVMSVCTVLFYH